MPTQHKFLDGCIVLKLMNSECLFNEAKYIIVSNIIRSLDCKQNVSTLFRGFLLFLLFFYLKLPYTVGHFHGGRYGS